MKTSNRSRISSPRPRSASLSSGTSKKSSTLPNETVEYLKAWMMSPEHIAHPYPTDTEKAKIMEDTGIALKQLTNWFVNNRKRYWKPRVESKLQEHQCPSNIQQDSTVASVVTMATITAASFKPRSSTQAALKSKLPRNVSLLDDVSMIDDQIYTELDTSDQRHVRKTSPFAGSINESDLSLAAEVTDERGAPVEEHTSAASVTDSGSVSHSSSSDDEWSPSHSTLEVRRERSQRKMELIDVHILRPNDESLTPTLSDVTVLPHVPESRILRTFKRCSIIYSLAFVQDSWSVSNDDLVSMIAERRDNEILRVKKQCLQICLNERNGPQDSQSGRPVLKNSSGLVEPSVQRRKRTIPDDTSYEASASFKLSRVDDNENLSKTTSYDSAHLYCEQDASSLNDAAQLFGFAEALRKNFLKN